MDSAAQEVVAYFDADRTGIQVSSAFLVLAVPFLFWFLAAVASLAEPRAAILALASGAVAAGVFLTDVAALMVGALRPENMAESPELAQALHDYSWVAPAASAPLFSVMLAALATLALDGRWHWPRWLGLAGLAAAAAYLMRTGGMFTDDGVWAADGVLGFWIPIVALQGWIFAASLTLWLAGRRA